MLRRLLRLSGPAIAAFVWKNRDEVIDWAAFGLRAAKAAVPGGEGFDDVKVEARLRLALARDPRTRGVGGLHVDVRDGVARLRGLVPADVRDAALAAADEVDALAVDDQLRVHKPRWRRG